MGATDNVIRIGQTIPGWCGGNFPLDTMRYELRVEAIGADWVVVRCIETHSVYFFDGDLEQFAEDVQFERARQIHE